MYKLLIVDDEKEIRAGLSGWPWESVNLQVAGTCSQGLEALQFVSSQPVDVILTDIRMPFMDGLELMKAMKRLHPFTKIVILSGYNEFEYAKQAISSGAVSYLLKPINEEELRTVFQELTRKMDEEKQGEYRTLALERKERLLVKVLRDDFLNRMFQAPIPEDEWEQACSEGELILDAGSYSVAAARLDRLVLDSSRIASRELKLIVFSLDNILTDIWDAQGRGYHTVDRTNGSFYLLAAEPNAHEEFVGAIRKLEKFIGLFKSTISIAIGLANCPPQDIHLSAKTALHKLRGVGVEEGSAVAVYDPTTDSFPANEPPGEVRQSGAEEPRSHADEPFILAKAKQFIRDHYHRSITLKEAAHHVYISPGYLSALFKETGETFLAFLTSLRMAKSMELLSSTDKKIYEIVEMVGYSDPAYFAEVFKRHTGMTPGEYRNSHYARPGVRHDSPAE